MVCHHLKPSIPGGPGICRVTGSGFVDDTAEDVLHDLGMIWMIHSDSQAMGRTGLTIIRTQVDAHGT